MFKVQGLEFRVQGSGFRVQGSGYPELLNRRVATGSLLAVGKREARSPRFEVINERFSRVSDDSSPLANASGNDSHRLTPMVLIKGQGSRVTGPGSRVNE